MEQKTWKSGMIQHRFLVQLHPGRFLQVVVEVPGLVIGVVVEALRVHMWHGGLDQKGNWLEWTNHHRPCGKSPWRLGCKLV